MAFRATEGIRQVWGCRRQGLQVVDAVLRPGGICWLLLHSPSARSNHHAKDYYSRHAQRPRLHETTHPTQLTYIPRPPSRPSLTLPSHLCQVLLAPVLALHHHRSNRSAFHPQQSEGCRWLSCRPCSRECDPSHHQLRPCSPISTHACNSGDRGPCATL